MADTQAPTALITTESILIDGANGVTAASRAHFPEGGVFLVVAVVVAVLARVVKRAAVVVAVLLIGALPGLVQVLALRADAPFKRGAMTDSIGVTLSDLQRRAPWPSSQAQVIHEEDDVLFPLGRYALPSRPVVDGGIAVELLAGPVGQPCRLEGPLVTCGARP